MGHSALYSLVPVGSGEATGCALAPFAIRDSEGLLQLLCFIAPVFMAFVREIISGLLISEFPYAFCVRWEGFFVLFCFLCVFCDLVSIG